MAALDQTISHEIDIWRRSKMHQSLGPATDTSTGSEPPNLLRCRSPFPQQPLSSLTSNPAVEARSLAAPAATSPSAVPQTRHPKQPEGCGLAGYQAYETLLEELASHLLTSCPADPRKALLQYLDATHGSAAPSTTPDTSAASVRPQAEQNAQAASRPEEQAAEAVDHALARLGFSTSYLSTRRVSKRFLDGMTRLHRLEYLPDDPLLTVAEQSLLPYETTHFYRLYAKACCHGLPNPKDRYGALRDLPRISSLDIADCDGKPFAEADIAASLPEELDVPMTWLESAQPPPLLRLPLRRMWLECLNFDSSADVPNSGATRVPTLRPSTTWDASAGHDALDRAVWFYTTNAFSPLNHALRADDPLLLPCFMPIYRNLDLYIQQHPLPVPTRTYRGTTLTPAQFHAFQKNKYYRLSSLVSTAMDPAQSFQKPVRLRFMVPAGCRTAAAITALSEYAEEGEVLLFAYTVVRCVAKNEDARLIEFDVMEDSQDWGLRQERLGGALWERPFCSPDAPYAWAPSHGDVNQCLQQVPLDDDALRTALQPRVRVPEGAWAPKRIRAFWRRVWREAAAFSDVVPVQAARFYLADSPAPDDVTPYAVIQHYLRAPDDAASAAFLRVMAPWFEAFRMFFARFPANPASASPARAYIGIPMRWSELRQNCRCAGEFYEFRDIRTTHPTRQEIEAWFATGSRARSSGGAYVLFSFNIPPASPGAADFSWVRPNEGIVLWKRSFHTVDSVDTAASPVEVQLTFQPHVVCRCQSLTP